MRFTETVNILEGTEVRDTAGGVTYDLTPIEGLTGLWATIMPTVDERRQERMTPDENKWTIVLAGHWPQITPSMWVEGGEQRYEVVRASTTKRRRVTTLVARQGEL